MGRGGRRLEEVSPEVEQEPRAPSVDSSMVDTGHGEMASLDLHRVSCPAHFWDLDLRHQNLRE